MKTLWLITGFWFGQAIESLIIQIGWIKLSIDEMEYNFLLTFIFLILTIYGEYKIKKIRNRRKELK
jgi:hypothetical protein